MYIVVNQRLEKVLPIDSYIPLNDPSSYSEPDQIWIADVVLAGRGKERLVALETCSVVIGF